MPYGAGEGLAHLAGFIAGMANGGADNTAPGQSPTIGQRLSAGVQSAAEGYDNFVEQQNRLNAAGKSAQYYFKANPDALDELGVDEAQTQNFGSKDWAALAQSHVTKQANQMAAAKIQEYNAIANEQQQKVQDEQTAGTFLQNYLTAPTTQKDDNGVDQPLTPADRLNIAAQKTPNMSGRILPKVMDSLSKWQQANQGDEVNNPVQVDTNSIPNNAIVTRKRGSSFQVIPTGGVTTQMVDDGNGGKVPVIIGPKGQPKQLRGGTQLAPKDALTTYNANQKRMGEIAQQIKMAKGDPDVAKVMDPEALQAELEDLQGQNAKLKPIWSAAPGGAAKPATVNPDDVKWLLHKPTPERIKSFENTYGKGAADQYLP